MSQYLDVGLPVGNAPASGYALLSLMPTAGLVEVEAQYPGFIAGQLIKWSGHIDAILAKRYATPFAAPYADQLGLWLAALVDPRVYMRRGVDTNDAQIDQLIKDAERVEDQLKEAADAVEGLYNLPLRADNPNSALRTKVLVRYDVTPYDAFKRQYYQSGGTYVPGGRYGV